MKRIPGIAFILSLSLLAWHRPQKKIKLWLIGDSTMSIKDPKAYPEHGWGMPFVYFWDSTVTVDNRAKNGRSTQSFMDEGLWKPVMEQMQEGDYVFIQFGHNDEVPTKKTFTTEKQFSDNLKKYIDDTRSKKGIPVLITPVARRKFDSTGHITETHAVYAQIVRDVAKANNVWLIDLSEKSKALLQQMGPQSSKYLFNYLEAGEHPNYPEGKQDDTHFSELGARKMAELVLADIRTGDASLAKRIIVKPAAK
ncbi:MAG TPA: rhamnogalacturonan acetylesterase, partial [Chitinophagaceae bacterium]|jgi:lysophospholipase L1-like esterase|nr:rhamnogalacturonan acetylesterase [Chitinophagaceae bacterium]